MSMLIQMVAAMAYGNVIGNSAIAMTPDAPMGLPWKKIPSDMRRFRELTKNTLVIMGRKTADALLYHTGGPLPKRVCLVVSREPHLCQKLEDAGFCIHRKESCMNIIREMKADERQGGTTLPISIIGGGEIFREFLPIADKLCITHIHTTIGGGDVKFPEIDTGGVWEVVKEVVVKNNTEDPYDTTYREYCKKTNA